MRIARSPGLRGAIAFEASGHLDAQESGSISVPIDVQISVQISGRIAFG